MAACERTMEQLLSVPMLEDGEWWIAVGIFEWRRLTPEFIGEPKCLCPDGTRHDIHYTMAPGTFAKCSKCGAILSDRRHVTRRQGGRRMLSSYGGRRLVSISGFVHDRRIGIHRRRP